MIDRWLMIAVALVVLLMVAALMIEPDTRMMDMILYGDRFGR